VLDYMGSQISRRGEYHPPDSSIQLIVSAPELVRDGPKNPQIQYHKQETIFDNAGPQLLHRDLNRTTFPSYPLMNSIQHIPLLKLVSIHTPPTNTITSRDSLVLLDISIWAVMVTELIHNLVMEV
jgi:hypothetical protein